MTTTTTFNVQLLLQVTTGAATEDFDEHTDAVYEALLTMDRVSDADMAASLADKTISFSVWVEDADSPGEALDVAFGAVRAAIHTEDGYTPGWEEALQRARADVSPVLQDA